MKRNTYCLLTCFQKIKKKKKKQWFCNRFTVLLTSIFIALRKNDKSRLHKSRKIKERLLYTCIANSMTALTPAFIPMKNPILVRIKKQIIHTFILIHVQMKIKLAYWNLMLSQCAFVKYSPHIYIDPSHALKKTLFLREMTSNVLLHYDDNLNKVENAFTTF